MFEKVRESFARLSSRSDFIVIEGAGSIAEINLKSHDIANLRVAEMAGCPVILVADIDRGGVFAQIIGTMELLEPHERERVRGIIINKFRGDPSLLHPAIEFVEERTQLPVLGVIPCFTGFRIPDEDSVALSKRGPGNREQGTVENRIRIGVVKLPRISNFTDFDALEAEPDVELRYIDGAREVEGMDVLILPGSKSTIADLRFLREQGLFRAIKTFAGMVVGSLRRLPDAGATGARSVQPGIPYSQGRRAGAPGCGNRHADGEGDSSGRSPAPPRRGADRSRLQGEAHLLRDPHGRDGYRAAGASLCHHHPPLRQGDENQRWRGFS